jgi:D-glycero-D-manno-heptose 1,7-bisphosphate phosphatase
MIVSGGPMELSGNNLFSNVDFVFLDRDGVINRKARESEYVWQWSDFHPLPDVEAAILSFNRSGRRVIVVTNQRGVARGLYTLDQVDSLHDRLQKHLTRFGAHIDAFYVCTHDYLQCSCRKPKTGLLEQAFRDFPKATKRNSIVIGDSVSDIQLALAFGIRSILIRDDARILSPDDESTLSMATAVSSSLKQAVDTYFITPG